MNSIAQTGYGGAGSVNVGTSSARNFSIVTSNATRLTVDTSGNVGIGITPSTGKLHVVNTTSGLTTVFATHSDGATWSSSGQFYNSSATGTVDGGILRVQATAQDNTNIVLFNVADSNSEIFKILGTGATTLTGSLTVSGDVRANGNLPVAGWIGAGCEAYCESSGGYSLLYGDGHGVLTSYLQVNGGITDTAGTRMDSGGGWFRTYNSTGWYNGSYGGGWYMTDTTYVRVYNSKTIWGNNGIQIDAGTGRFNNSSFSGGGNPSLRVCNDSGIGVCATIGHSGYYGGNLHIDAGVSSGGSGVYMNWYAGGGGVHAGNGASGYGPMYASAFTVSSSRTLKHDITNINYGLNEVLQLNPVNFVYNNDPTNTNQIGFISEDVRPIMPEVTVWNSGTSTYGIDYAKFTPVLVKAVQEQQAEIDALQAGSFADINVSGQLDAVDLNVTGVATIQKLVVLGDAEVHQITINGKIITAGAAPTVALGVDATGYQAAAVVSGNDTAGNVSYDAGTEVLPVNPLVSGKQIDITFHDAYTTAPRIALTAKDENSASVRTFVETTATGFTVHFLDAPQTGKTYAFDYIVIQ
jgi:hypothetical protein